MMSDADQTKYDLKSARKKATRLRLGDSKYTLIVCMDRKTAKCCHVAAMNETWRQIKIRCKQLRKQGQAPVLRIKSGCIGICKSGPIIGVLPDALWYGACTPEIVDRIFDEHLAAGSPVVSHLIAQPSDRTAILAIAPAASLHRVGNDA